MGMQNAFAVDKIELQRGASFFMNYCAGCHSLKYVRPDAIIGHQFVTQVSMPEADARQWFGRMPPDLSLIARQRSAGWLSSYLTSFYADSTRPFGANNALMPDVGMPNVLAPLQHNTTFYHDVHDVVSFLVYVAEPKKLIRYRIGAGVMAFLTVFTILIWRLKLLCWRNICENLSTRRENVVK